jgi:ribosomal protein S18 acetylase RimI-like enzyme
LSECSNEARVQLSRHRLGLLLRNGRNNHRAAFALPLNLGVGPLLLMNLSLRPAEASELTISESLSRLNMMSYRQARDVAWDSERFRQSWRDFENLAIIDDSQCLLGFVRLLVEGDALAIRDLQILPEFQYRGIGSWAISQVKQMAMARGFAVVQLRVYPENPALALYTRHGFVVDRVENTVVHMRCLLRQDELLAKS